MPRKPSPQGAALPRKAAKPHTLYSEAAAEVFRSAIEVLESKLPTHQAGLLALFERGELHDASAVEAVLKAGAQ
jgi:hypothetical protein